MPFLPVTLLMTSFLVLFLFFCKDHCVGMGSRMAVTLKGHWCLSTQWDLLGGQSRRLLGTFGCVVGLISKHLT